MVLVLASPPMADLSRLATPEQLERIGAILAERERWPAGSWAIELLPDWDQARLTVLLAHSTTKKTGRRPAFAVVGGEVVADSDDAALEQLVRHAFREVTPADAPALARLAAWFGGHGLHEARYVASLPGSKAKLPGLPRQSAEPVYERRGEAHVVRFYVYQHAQQRLHDCTLTITPAGVELEHRLVATPSGTQPETP